MRRPAWSAKARPVPVRQGGSDGRTARPVLAPTGDRAVSIGRLLQEGVQRHQSGQHAEAERLYRQVLSIDPRQADALHLLGVLALQVGRPDVAAEQIRQAVAERPGAPAFRMNLGNALLALGVVSDAVASYRQAALLAPTDPETHYNLGNALVQHGDLTDGIAALRRAVQLRPDHVAAQYNLGNALRVAGQLEEAASAYQNALKLQPALLDADTNLGLTLLALGRHGAAQACFARVLAARPGDAGAARNLAEALRADGQAEAALRTTCASLEHSPTDRTLITLLVDLLQSVPVTSVDAVVRAALLAACADDTFDLQQLATPIARLVVAAPEWAGLLASVRAGHDPLAAGVAVPEVLLSEPAVLAALPRVVICLPDLERVLTALRRSALLRTMAPAPSDHVGAGGAVDAPERLPHSFLCALAGAAFLVEHAWYVEPDEAAVLERLQESLTALLADPAADPVAVEDRLLLAALYGRLGALPGASRLAEIPDDRWSSPFRSIIREQVLEPLDERRFATEIPALTPIQDATSQAVQAMYEENPYPRWRAARFHGAQMLAARFQQLCPNDAVPEWPERPAILVAGSGTGQHPIQVALRYPDADVLTVDLSLPSLAYGARMAEKLGVPNVRFAQADILALDMLDEQFALIESAGVLHHLADPLAGWAVLRRLLRPDGLMHIALYSERARAGIVAARSLIADEALPSTVDGIRAARRRIVDLPANHPAAGLATFRDFYSVSGFRDLAMHVQEHRFTVPQLAAALDTLDLRFLGFDLSEPLVERFRARFPSPGAALDLACWDQFEANHPDTFASMYQFWCRPR